MIASLQVIVNYITIWGLFNMCVCVCVHGSSLRVISQEVSEKNTENAKAMQNDARLII